MRIVAGLIWGFWLASMNHSRQVSGVAIHDHESSTPNYSSYSSQTNGSSSATKHGSSADREHKDDAKKHFQRYVFAHVVAGNAQNYTKEEWISDMKTAQAAHIDAFAINIGVDASNEVQLPMIYDSAKSLGFKVFISFDMNYYAYPGSSKDIEKRVLQFSKHPAQFQYQNKTFISTFSGEVPGTFMDANQNYTAAWCTLKASLRGHGVNTYFVPGWTGIKPATSRCADGLLSWDAWPHNTDIPANFEQVNLNVTTQENLYFPDKAAMLASRAVSKTFAAPVAPLFYKHLNPAQTDNYIYRSDDWMMINRYTNLIKQDEPPEFIELLTWNDYGESHYLRDPQPTANLPSGMISAHQYVDGFSHTAFLNLLSYFNQWYKTGTPPTLDQTTMYIWYRPHVKNASATNDLLPAPAFANLTEDRIYGYVIPAPNTSVSAVRILSGYQVLEQALFPLNDTSPSVNGSHLCQIVEDLSNNNEAEVDGTGILVSAPLEPGNQLLELLNDEGETLISLQGRPVEALPETYNFNYWSGSIAF
ncbi:hypothetical protein PCANC_07879 [Puccinia coronata f. sp. avenae]|uniref:Glycoside hydrolase family 71 protein n=2 Tax=Puccinia coronata f. sp. avenae TaxID=200324 RepID=A0A2N5T8W8_9BASI|nr:hypothetical protein PCASD_12882 [Puccinia coronata f. sp. avenae]PLW47847.1 hypothetical protein PCANC_07879 [Puccinia coronata f. sp. avenae]